MTSLRSLIPGDLLGIPLPKGLFGAALVIEAGESHVLLVLDGFWDHLPSPAEVGDSGLMPSYPRGIKDDFYDDVLKGWFEGDAPLDFTRILHKDLAPYETSLAKPRGTMVFQSPEHFREHLFERWRWIFDEEALIAEIDGRRLRYEEGERLRLRNRPLSKMMRERPFAHWVEMWPKPVVDEAHQILREATRQLIALKRAKSPTEDSERVLRGIVDSFNDLDERTGCIETQEAGEIVERIEELASKVGLDNDNESLTGHRDW
jgi:hypothetical protein